MGFTMQSGEFRHWVAIERLTDQDELDADGIDAPQWKPLLRAKAKIVNVHGDEFLQAFGAGSKITKTFWLRGCRGIKITNKDRLIYDGITFNIVYVNDVVDAHRYVEIKCEVAE